MKYPRHEIYEKLYKRYFIKGVDYLVDEGKLKPQDKVIDICGGNGRLTRELVKKCNSVSYLDQERDMIPDDLESLGVKVFNKSVEEFVNTNHEKYSVGFCEQAINYWLKSVDVKKFADIFLKDGLFVFNTFSNEPSIKPMIKEYVIDDLNYLEISYLVGSKVYHVQICEGYEPHFTVFDYISKKEFTDILSPYFDVAVKDNGKSSLYLCRRK